MTKLVVLFVSALMVALASSNIPGDNSHYKDGDRFIWFADDGGNPVLVDLFAEQSPFKMAGPSNQGANNVYYLYTRSNRLRPQQVELDDNLGLLSSNFDASRTTKVVVHGWLGNKDSGVNTLNQPAFLEDGDYNVFVVDWSHTSNELYTTCVGAVPDIGKDLANFLVFLNANGMPYNNTHLVGHSLGAHIAGHAGRLVDGQVARITGLDPAGPLWQLNNGRLKSSDAQLVEALHTDAGALGYRDPFGDIDFYPNGGSRQPGCSLSTCDHDRAFQLFAASLRYNKFLAKECSGVSEATSTTCAGKKTEWMGNSQLSKSNHGLFGLETSSSYPYAL